MMNNERAKDHAGKMERDRRSNNFDFLRLLFALTVAIVHCSELSRADLLSSVTQYLSSGVAVDSFFIISGFLIFMSYESSKSLTSYAGKRIRRIFPGYLAVIVISAISLYTVSTKPFSEYFNTELLRYIFFNAITLNFICPTLPGVFEDNQIQAVNGALWTIKIEVMFYAAVPFLALLLSKFNKAFVLFPIYILSTAYSSALLFLYSDSGAEIYLKLERQLPGQLAFFISGAAVYYFQNFFHKRSLLLLALSSSAIFFNRYISDVSILYPISLAVIVLYFANIFKYLGNWGKFGDLSFGIYIWHFPILQVFVSYNIFIHPVTGILLFLTTLFLVSFLSWHVIEKRWLHSSSHYRVSEHDNTTKKMALESLTTS